MNISTTKVFSNVSLALGVALVVLVAVMFMPTPAQANWGEAGSFDGGGLGGGFGGYTGGDWSSSGFGDSGVCDFGCGGGYTGGDWSSSGWGDTGSCSTCGGQMYDYGANTYPSYSPGYSSGGFSNPGSYTLPSYYTTSSSYIPYTPSQAGRLSTSNTNTNLNYNFNSEYCTGNSCNTTYNDNSVFNAPTVVTTDSHAIVNFSTPTYQTPQPPVYTPPVYTPPQIYPSYQPRVAYAAQPYISLSQAPYTGLEMGPMATALYWGFLIAWCLLAAYLIAVKKVHYKLAAWFSGSSVEKVAHVAHAPAVHAAPKVAAAAPAPAHSGIDPFIASQINR